MYRFFGCGFFIPEAQHPLPERTWNPHRMQGKWTRADELVYIPVGESTAYHKASDVDNLITNNRKHGLLQNALDSNLL